MLTVGIMTADVGSLKNEHQQRDEIKLFEYLFKFIRDGAVPGISGEISTAQLEKGRSI